MFTQKRGETDNIPLMEAQGGKSPAPRARRSNFGIYFVLWQLVLIFLYATCTKYSDLASSANSADTLDTEVGDAICDMLTDPDQVAECYVAQSAAARREYVEYKYPLFQDVNVMIFVGFGFLMTFLAKHSYSSVGFNFMVAAACVQWYILAGGFFVQLLDRGECSPESGPLELEKVELSLDSLIAGDFGAGAVLITFGVLLGKVSSSQLLVISILEIVFYAINEGMSYRLGVADPGGSMIIHMFGAFFGLACSYAFTPRNHLDNPMNTSVYHSDMFAMIGTLFLWMFWPSFNGILTAGALFHRIVINTVLSLVGSCFVAFCASNLLRGEGKFNMVDVQNATLAGGVGIGTAAGLLGNAYAPGMALAVGGICGFVSVYGYVVVQPWLENTLGLSDTCGVNNLHGIPSVIGAVVGVIASSQASEHLGTDQIEELFPCVGTGTPPRSLGDQWKFQLAYMCFTLLFSMVTGGLTGLLTRRYFAPFTAEEHFKDDSSWQVPDLELPYYFDERGELVREDTGRGSGKTVA